MTITEYSIYLKNLTFCFIRSMYGYKIKPFVPVIAKIAQCSSKVSSPFAPPTPFTRCPLSEDAACFVVQTTDQPYYFWPVVQTVSIRGIPARAIPYLYTV